MNINFKISSTAIFAIAIGILMAIGISLMEDTWCETGSAIIYSTYMEIIAMAYIVKTCFKKKENDKNKEDR